MGDRRLALCANEFVPVDMVDKVIRGQAPAQTRLDVRRQSRRS
jgi:hypothetical protein